VGPVVIETARLRMREWTPEDRPAVERLTSDPSVIRWLNSGQPYPDAEIDRFIQRRLDDQSERGWSRWALELISPAEGDPTGIVGFCGFGSAVAREPELGWTLLSALQGRGLATEAGCAALQFGWDVARFPLVISAILPDNVASRRVAEKLGMRVNGTHEHVGLVHLRYEIANPGL
jgi:RimJ/RimL family protein N-acetyltransferase